MRSATSRDEVPIAWPLQLPVTLGANRAFLVEPVSSIDTDIGGTECKQLSSSSQSFTDLIVHVE